MDYKKKFYDYGRSLGIKMGDLQRLMSFAKEHFYRENYIIIDKEICIHQWENNQCKKCLAHK